MKGLNCRVRTIYQNTRDIYSLFQVVERDSSILGWSSEIAIAASANHSSICKFPQPDDSRYQTACFSIVEMIDGESKLIVIGKSEWVITN